MNRRILLFVLISFPLLQSCNAHRGEDELFRMKSKTSIERISDTMSEYTSIVDLMGFEHYLVMIGLNLKSDTWVHVFDLDAKSFLLDAIPRGRGPGEMIHCSNVSMNGSGTFILTDRMKKVQVVFNLLELLRDGASSIRENKVDIPAFNVYSYQPDTSCYLYVQNPSEQALSRSAISRFYVRSARSSDTLSVSDGYYYQDNASNWAVYNYSQFASLGSRFVAGSTLGGLLEGYEVHDYTVKKLFAKEVFPVLLNRDGTFSSACLWGFSDLYPETEGIWTIFDGEHSKDCDEPKFCNVALWDWSGVGLAAWKTEMELERICMIGRRMYSVVRSSDGQFFLAALPEVHPL